MAAAAPPPQTVLDGIVLCGVNNVIQFNGDTAAARIAGEIFDGSFETCLDITFKELDNDFKTYSALTVTQGQIRV